MAPIGDITTTNFGKLLAPSITWRAVRELFRVHFPFARNIHFIAMMLTIREHMGLVTVETNGSLVRVLSSIMPMISLIHIPSIGSVQIMIVIICEVEDIEDALDSIA